MFVPLPMVPDAAQTSGWVQQQGYSALLIIILQADFLACTTSPAGCLVVLWIEIIIIACSGRRIRIHGTAKNRLIVT